RSSHNSDRPLSCLVSPRPFLRPHTDKANLRIVTIQDEAMWRQDEQLAVERRAAKIVGVEAQEQMVARCGIERETPADHAVDRNQWIDLRCIVPGGLDAALLVGARQAFAARSGVDHDHVEPIAILAEAGLL